MTTDKRLPCQSVSFELVNNQWLYMNVPTLRCSRQTISEGSHHFSLRAHWEGGTWPICQSGCLSCQGFHISVTYSFAQWWQYLLKPVRALWRSTTRVIAIKLSAAPDSVSIAMVMACTQGRNSLKGTTDMRRNYAPESSGATNWMSTLVLYEYIN